jgi:uncharacterized protein (UPF0276 family)
MIKIACNCSAELSDLIINKQVDIDYIKCWVSGEFEKQIETIRLLKPVLLHGLGYFEYLGMKNIDVIDFPKANKYIMQCASPHYGVHMAMCSNDITLNASDEDVYIYLSKQIQIFKKNICVPLLLENPPDFPKTLQNRFIKEGDPYFLAYTEPEKVSKLLNDNDVGLLLDLTHSRLTCLYNNLNIYDFLRNLPLQRIKEIHVNGFGYDEQGFAADTHQSMHDEDFELLDWILGYCKPDIVTLKYNGIKSESQEIIIENLHKQLKRLFVVCQNIKAL